MADVVVVCRVADVVVVCRIAAVVAEVGEDLLGQGLAPAAAVAVAVAVVGVVVLEATYIHQPLIV